MDLDQGPPRRIAIVYDCVYPFVPGGGQKRLFEIAVRLVKKGWHVDWYGLKSWPEPGPIVVDGIRFIAVADAKPLYRDDGKRSIWQTLRFGMAVARFPSLRHYDLIHMGQWPYFHYFPARLFALFGKAQISVDWWEVWATHWLVYFGWKGHLGMMLERICSQIPSALIAISETGARQLKDIGVDADRIHIIHNGINGQSIREATPADERSDLLYVGRLQPHKNVDCLIRALAIVRDGGCILSLTIVGDGPERDALEALTDHLTLRDQVRFLGALETDEEVRSQFKAARIFVHPSTKEGGGSITSLEANAAGLPVIAIAHPGGISPELIEEGVNGYWVDDLTPEALATVIEQAARQGDKAARSARCTAFANPFEWDVLADHYHALFSARAAKVESP
jgi:L-malate glycosyltransferase